MLAPLYRKHPVETDLILYRLQSQSSASITVLLRLGRHLGAMTRAACRVVRRREYNRMRTALERPPLAVITVMPDPTHAYRPRAATLPHS